MPWPAYDRLWGNNFTSGTGDALSAVAIAAAVRQPGPMTGAEEGWWFFGGADLSVSRDTAAVVITGKDQYGRLRLAAVRAWTPPRGGQVDLAAVRDEVIALHRRFRCIYYFDIHQGALLAQEAGKAGVWLEAIPFQGAAATEMATCLIEAFTSRNIELYDDPALLADLKCLRIEERPTAGAWRPIGRRPDTVTGPRRLPCRSWRPSGRRCQRRSRGMSCLQP